MRKLLLLVVSLVTLTCTSLASADTTQSFEASFNEGFGRATAHPCQPAQGFVFCGQGTLAGFGQATTFTELVSFENFDPETGCGDTTLQRTITLEDGSSLVLLQTGTVCFPGKSFGAPGAMKSFGNPFRIEGTFEAVEGTGVFEGATASGTFHITSAGDQVHSTLFGTITLC